MGPVTKAAVLAAGKGTRMRGLCDDYPKPLLRVANVPLLELTLRRLQGAGITDVLLVVGHCAAQIEAAIADGSRWGLNVTYVLQAGPKGTGEAALLCEDFARGQPFMLVFGDILTARANYAKANELIRQPGADGVLSVWNTPDPSRGAATFVRDGRVTKIVEKPPRGTTQSNWDNAGMFIFPAAIFDAVRSVGLSERGEYELTAAIQLLLEQGANLRALELAGFWFNLTDPETLLEANRCILHEQLAAGEAMVGQATSIDRRAIVDRVARVGSRCRIGRARVGFNVTICDDVVVEDGAELRSCIVLPGARVGFSTVVNAIVPPGYHVEDAHNVVGQVALAGIDT